MTHLNFKRLLGAPNLLSAASPKISFSTYTSSLVLIVTVTHPVQVHVPTQSKTSRSTDLQLLPDCYNRSFDFKNNQEPALGLIVALHCDSQLEYDNSEADNHGNHNVLITAISRQSDICRTSLSSLKLGGRSRLLKAKIRI